MIEGQKEPTLCASTLCTYCNNYKGVAKAGTARGSRNNVAGSVFYMHQQEKGPEENLQNSNLHP